MEQLNTYLYIAERDVDLLILEELLVSQSFSNWFVSMVFSQDIYANTIGAWHSVCDSTLGESDLIYKFESVSGLHQAILIENKISADAQLEQAVRYKKRGEKGTENGDWSSFKTCLLAPQRYLDQNSELYDCEISYEQVIGYFNSQSDLRSKYRASFLSEGVEKNRRGYQSVVCERMTSFAKSYLEFVSAHHPELNPEKAKPRAAGHTWIHFSPLKNEPNTKIVHQISGNVIKIMYLDQIERYDEIVDKFKQFQKHGLVVKRSSKSVIVEAKAPTIDPLIQDFDEVYEKIVESVAIALDLKEELCK